MIKVQNNIATREPVPQFLRGLAPESLTDLSWTDPLLGVQGAAWWPERDDTPPLGPDQVYDGSEVLTAEANTRQVTVVRGIRNMTTEGLHERGLEANPVPQSCTRRQGRLALLQSGMLDNVEAAISAIADPTERRAAQIEYDADTWERGNPFLQEMWARMGGTPETLDDTFRLAVTL